MSDSWRFESAPCLVKVRSLSSAPASGSAAAKSSGSRAAENAPGKPICGKDPHESQPQTAVPPESNLVHFQFTTFIVQVGQRLCMGQDAVYAAIKLFHRFKSQPSELPEKLDEHIVAAACVFIAIKIEEIAGVKLRDVITCAYRLLRPEKAVLTDVTAYQGLRTRLLKAEMAVLKQLGFLVKEPTPHKYLLHQLLLYAQWLGSDVCTRYPLSSLAVAMLQDTAHDPALCLAVPQSRLAAACVYLAVKCLKLDAEMGPLHGIQWWKPLAFEESEDELQRLSREIMRVYAPPDKS